jgi:hypothetical protein
MSGDPYTCQSESCHRSVACIIRWHRSQSFLADDQCPIEAGRRGRWGDTLQDISDESPGYNDSRFRWRKNVFYGWKAECEALVFDYGYVVCAWWAKCFQPRTKRKHTINQKNWMMPGWISLWQWLDKSEVSVMSMMMQWWFSRWDGRRHKRWRDDLRSICPILLILGLST